MGDEAVVCFELLLRHFLGGKMVRLQLFFGGGRLFLGVDAVLASRAWFRRIGADAD